MKPESIRIRARQGSEERGQLRVVNLSRFNARPL
jgi:hypothetical protein